MIARITIKKNLHFFVIMSQKEYQYKPEKTYKDREDFFCFLLEKAKGCKGNKRQLQ